MRCIVFFDSSYGVFFGAWVEMNREAGVLSVLLARLEEFLLGLIFYDVSGLRLMGLQITWENIPNLVKEGVRVVLLS